MMEFRNISNIKKHLEEVFDIPFIVKNDDENSNISFFVIPENDCQELFVLKVTITNHIRLTIEVEPEKYAAYSIKDMCEADINKKVMFVEYAKQLLRMKAKINFFINSELFDIIDYERWPNDWKSYRLRITRSPILNEYEFDILNIIFPWIKLVVGMMLSLLNVTLCDDSNYLEGGLKKIEVNKYERNPINRELCLAINGYKCKICGFDFEEKYGEIGHNYIHVHHIVPISTMSEKYRINPVTDMIPVCPNCHAMLHKKNPPLHPEELKKIIKENK